MEHKKIYVLGILSGIIFFILGFSDIKEQKEEFSELVKIALRDVGNQLLLTNQDSTSLVLPVIELKKSKYQLSFENSLSFDPSDLTSIIKESFQKAGLPKQYRVEVLRCFDQEVPYSFLIKDDITRDIIPCGGRFLPKGCYTIEVRFTETQPQSSSFGKQTLIYGLLFIVLILLLLVLYRRKQLHVTNKSGANYASIGSFQFYPEQHKLIKQTVEISLSKKECELLEIFVAKPNQIVKRDELIKKVWEDNGVIVGRSLDTYISKLRKKLKDDQTIKLINIHGIGYKLEIKP
ncbi:transcriptional regulator [Aquimarina sp. MAR_2010_214]|uniref:winged helix-turn-helix domain-containing protein n=1 Tax=Aquimarina sp. MAR_2010_214 TaxID=1250026 RepID=UPI000C70D8DF|nr:winged helix-turn-helix domain-containing protein [Aquimarina sp. MAR_2010_214]PKV53118.1 transcriptional regulator [Aquimarina sp. MAR_2010_214]